MDKSKLNKIKVYLISGALAAAIIFLVWAYITPTVAVINNDRTHEIVNPFGSLKVLNSDNNEIELNDLKLCTRYVFNGTDTPLIGYSVCTATTKPQPRNLRRISILLARTSWLRWMRYPTSSLRNPKALR